jgi:SAM-dependent methyltransferase
MMNTTANADQQELDKFGEVAHRWWDPNSEFRPLHDINPARVAWIDAHAELKDKRVIDIGCGGGLLSEGMAALGAQVTGIDLSEKALSVARLHLYESGHADRLSPDLGGGHGRRSARQLRPRHLPGNAGTRARSRPARWPPAPAWSSPAGRCSCPP